MRFVVLASALLFLGCQARATGLHAATAADPVPAREDALELHYRALVETMRSEGLASGPLFERGFLPPSARSAFPVEVAAAQCAVFVAIGTASMSDLDAALFTADGEPLVEDDRVSARPTLTLCAADRPIAAYLTLHAYQGAGSFIAAQFTRPARSGDDLNTAFDGHHISALGQLAQLLHERGFEDAAPRLELALGDTRPVRIAFNVDAGECYTLAAEPSGGLAEVGLRLVDAKGGELADGVAEPRISALQYCADQRAELAVEIVARRGQGVARIGRFRAAQALVGGARALWLLEPTPSEAAWSAKSTEAAPAGKRPYSSERVSLKQGQIVELERRRSSSSCERWDAQLEPGLWRATLRVESEAGALLGEAQAEGMHACVRVCDPAPKRRVTLLGRAGFGNVTLNATAIGAAEEACGCQGAPCEASGAR
jgi:hypothetical protein